MLGVRVWTAEAFEVSDDIDGSAVKSYRIYFQNFHSHCTSILGIDVMIHDPVKGLGPK